MPRVTYRQAGDRILEVLESKGWEVSDPSLKFRWAEKGNRRIWFKAQALYAGGRTLGSANSLFIDSKELIKESADEIERTLASRLG